MGWSERGGVTLLEVVVAVALVGILGATAVLAHGAMRDALALREGAVQVAADLRAARLRALGMGRGQRLLFAAETRVYQAQEETTAGYVDAGEPRALPAGVVVVGCNADGGGIVFRPRGHAASFGTVTVRNRSGGVRRIVVNITGRVRIA
ncbi:GspH/FimT family protein [Candidatus Binatia bacterium]|nr:GspH/FimT family protein [Candidatus Binatia bacterium]